jgi:hypothetical protein
MKETNNTQSEKSLIEKLMEKVKLKVDQFSNEFNALPIRTKQVTVISFGMSVSMFCVVLMVKAIQAEIADATSIDKITLPKDIFMNNTDTTRHLIPVGKLKGEINGEFEAFYVAIDNEGNVFINRNPSFGASRFVKSEDWQNISRSQLEDYRKQLHFIPHKVKGLKP